MNHQREDEDNRHHFVSPISASSPEYGNFYGGFPPAHNPPEVNGQFPHNYNLPQVHGAFPQDYNLPEVNGGFPHDDGLPEVRVDNSPQALSNLEAEYKWRHFEEHEPKYPVVYDDSLKTAIPAPVLPCQSVAAAEQTPTATEPLPPQENRIFGLKRKIFFLVLAILVILIIAAGVGGGVGGSASHSKSNTPVLVVVDNVTVTSLSSGR
jgi:hypothetical protein